MHKSHLLLDGWRWGGGGGGGGGGCKEYNTWCQQQIYSVINSAVINHV